MVVYRLFEKKKNNFLVLINFISIRCSFFEFDEFSFSNKIFSLDFPQIWAAIF